MMRRHGFGGPLDVAAPAPGASSSSYHLPVPHLVVLIAVFALAPAAAGWVLFDVVIRRDIPFGNLLWLAIAGWNVYWFLLRFVHAVDVEEGVLRWRAPLRSGTVSIARLRRVRPSWIFSNIEVMETERGTSLPVWAVKGFDGFMGAVVAQRPDLPVRLSVQGRLAERLPVRSSFRAGPG
jgi:hypothetical protein